MKTTDKYPLTWPKCPACDSEKLVIGQLRQDMIDAGKWNPQVQAALLRHTAAMYDPSHPPLLTIPVVVALIDICADCGMLRCVRADLTEAKPELPQAGPPRNPNNMFPPGGFGRG